MWRIMGENGKRMVLGMGTDNNERYLVLDESGNLGTFGRYFVIACIDTNDIKALHNIMKRKIIQAGEVFPALKDLHTHEIKAKEAYPCVKYHILESIISKDISISYIVVDLANVRWRLLEDNNIMYNYTARLLLAKLITKKDEGTVINILFDNKTTKITSRNSLKDYIILYFTCERNLDVKINFKYMDSNSKRAYVIQAVDYVANAIYNSYEYENDLYMNVFKSKIKYKQHFPSKKS